MRIAVLVLMLVLLPLRGWAGAAMSVDHPAMAPAVAAAFTGDHAAAEAPPCHGESHAAPAAAAQPADGGCATCGLCDVCHSPLLGSLWPGPLPPQPPAMQPQPLPERFTSAPVRLLPEPPRT